MREWNCQLNISSNRWLHCRMLRNLFLLNHMGKPEKSCIWSGSGTAVQEWLEQAKCLLLFSPRIVTVHLSTLCSHTPSTETLLYVVLRGLCLWWSSACAHTAVVGLRNHWTLVIPLSSPQYRVNFCRSWMETVKCLTKPKNSSGYVNVSLKVLRNI